MSRKVSSRGGGCRWREEACRAWWNKPSSGRRRRGHGGMSAKVMRELWHCSATCKWEPAEESQLLVGALGDQNVLHGDQDLPPSFPAQLARGPGVGAWCRCHPCPFGSSCPVLGCLGPGVLGQAGKLPAGRCGCHSLGDGVPISSSAARWFFFFSFLLYLFFSPTLNIP